MSSSISTLYAWNHPFRYNTVLVKQNIIKSLNAIHFFNVDFGTIDIDIDGFEQVTNITMINNKVFIHYASGLHHTIKYHTILFSIFKYIHCHERTFLSCVVICFPSFELLNIYFTRSLEELSLIFM